MEREQSTEQQQMQMMKKNLEIAMHHANMLYWEFDILKDTVTLSKAAQEWFGLPETLKNYPDSFLSYGFLEPEMIPVHREAVKQIREGKPYIEFDARVKNHSGTFEWMRIRFSSISDDAGIPLRAFCTAETIAEYKELENLFITTLRQNNISNWIYDIRRHTVMLTPSTYYAFFRDERDEVPNVPESQIAEGLCHPEDVEIFRRLYRRIDQGEKQVEERLRFRLSSDREFRWQKCIYTVIEDDRGNPMYAIGSAIDITEQQEQHRKYKAAVEYRKRTQVDNLLLSGHCSITENRMLEMSDLSGLFLTCIAGDTMEDFFLRFADQIFDTGKRQEFGVLFCRETILKNLELGIHETEFNCEVVLPLKKETHLWITIHMDAVRVPETRVTEGFLTIMDVTAAHMQEQMLTTVVNQDYDYVMIVNIAENRYNLYAASDDKSMEGIPLQGNYEKQVREYADQLVVPEDRPVAAEGLQIAFLKRVLAEQEVYSMRARVAKADGSVRYKRIKASYLDAAHTHFLVTRVDITDIIEKEEEKRRELARALKLAEQATQAKTDFLSRMSHDLRTPMNVILGLSALTLDDAGNPDVVRNNMSKLHATSNFMLSLINDILDMAKIENGSVELHPEPYPYNDFVVNMKTMFAAHCAQKDIKLQMEVLKHNPVVLVDKTRLNQIFFNVLSNSIKYTPVGGTISYQLHYQERKTGKLACDFRITDTGIGMSEEFQKRMFDPFTQEDSRVTPELQGTGLGLSITKQLVEIMGGTIEIQSRKNEGTTVRIQLLLELVSEDAVIEDGEIEPLADMESGLAEKRVLLVEDHPLNAEIARKLLEKEKMRVFLAENGKVAVDKFEASIVGFFDVILMDIRMPEMDGYTACQKIRSLSRTDAATVPIIAMTANAYQTDREKSRLAGMNAHLAKPIEPKVLYKTLREVLF